MGRRKSIVRKVLDDAQSLGVYDVGETIEGLAQKLGKERSDILKLNSNENYFVPLGLLRSALKEVADEVDPRIYPRDEPKELRKALGQYLKVSPEQIVLGAGSDQLIDLVSRMLLSRGDEAVAISPTFSIYRRCVRIQGALYKPVPLMEDFSLDTERILAAVTPMTKLIFLCSPNNPTANQFSRLDIKRLAESFEGLVAVDEAYADFSDGSVVDLTDDFENLVVFRTFSKVFGFAGFRVGCAVANPEFARIMDERFQMPYSVTLIAVKVALKILERIGAVRLAVEEVKAERDRLIKRLNETSGVRAFDSKTNFILLQVEKSSDDVYKVLLKKGIIVRNIGRVLKYENCLRVTVAPPHVAERFLTDLGEVLSEDAA